jgi:hypothetical protein
MLMRAYTELVDFIAAGASAKEVAAFVPSDKAKARVRELLEKEKDETLTKAERYELDQYLHIEHLMRLAKARAKELLSAA